MTTITHDPNWVVWISFCSERESDSAWVALHCSPLYTEAKYSASGCKRMRSWCRIVRWFCRRLWRQKLSSKCFVLDYISGDQDLHVSIQYLTAITWIPCGALRHFKIIVLFFFAFNNSITFPFYKKIVSYGHFLILLLLRSECDSLSIKCVLNPEANFLLV